MRCYAALALCSGACRTRDALWHGSHKPTQIPRLWPGLRLRVQSVVSVTLLQSAADALVTVR